MSNQSAATLEGKKLKYTWVVFLFAEFEVVKIVCINEVSQTNYVL